MRAVSLLIVTHLLRAVTTTRPPAPQKVLLTSVRIAYLLEANLVQLEMNRCNGVGSSPWEADCTHPLIGKVIASLMLGLRIGFRSHMKMQELRDGNIQHCLKGLLGAEKKRKLIAEV